MSACQLITILGPTACGKTAVATRLAAELTMQAIEPTTAAAEIISADSRQVFKGMDIGTGKDLSDYDITVRHHGEEVRLHIPYHLIDIAEAGTKYSVFEFQRDFHQAYNKICSRACKPILCGGTGLYIESILRGYNLVEVPVNTALRTQLEGKELSELKEILASYKKLHNTTDVDTTRRAIRAIEIEAYYQTHHLEKSNTYPALTSLTIGLDIPRELRRKRISERLHRRLEEEDMAGEVQRLLDSGIPAEALISYGLEYRYLTLYLTGELSYDEMVKRLEIAIHQFAKRQMTYFHGMERRGITIHWIDAARAVDDIVQEILRDGLGT